MKNWKFTVQRRIEGKDDMVKLRAIYDDTQISKSLLMFSVIYKKMIKSIINNDKIWRPHHGYC